MAKVPPEDTEFSFEQYFPLHKKILYLSFKPHPLLSTLLSVLILFFRLRVDQKMYQFHIEDVYTKKL